MQRGLHFGPLPLSPLDPAFVLMWIVGAACALGAAWQAKFHRLVALVLAGGAGIVVCLTFVWLSAPDLALTQLLVEIVTTVLLLLGLRWLPKRVPFKWTAAGARGALPRRARDAAIAIASGCGLGLVSYAVMTRPLPDHAVSRFFIEHAWPMGGGTNVVNVIIVDFRGFDTLGEIAVLGVVAIAVYSLLRRFRPAPETMEPLPQRVHQSRAAATEDIAVPAVIMRGHVSGHGAARRFTCSCAGTTFPAADLSRALRSRWASSCNTWPEERAGRRSASRSGRCAGWGRDSA